MCSGSTPVICSRVCKCCITVNAGWNQHSFITRENSLAKCNCASGIVDYTNVGGGRLTIWLVRKWFRDLSVIVAVQTTVLAKLASIALRRRFETHHRLWIRIRCCFWIPLHADLTWWASIRTVTPWCTRLIWAHSPSSIRRSRCYSDKASISRELTLSSTLRKLEVEFLCPTLIYSSRSIFSMSSMEGFEVLMSAMFRMNGSY